MLTAYTRSAQIIIIIKPTSIHFLARARTLRYIHILKTAQPKPIRIEKGKD